MNANADRSLRRGVRSFRFADERQWTRFRSANWTAMENTAVPLVWKLYFEEFTDAARRQTFPSSAVRAAVPRSLRASRRLRLASPRLPSIKRPLLSPCYFSRNFPAIPRQWFLDTLSGTGSRLKRLIASREHDRERPRNENAPWKTIISPSYTGKADSPRLLL